MAFEAILWEYLNHLCDRQVKKLEVIAYYCYIISGHAHKQLSCTKPLPRGNICLSNKHEMRNLSK